MEEREGTIKLVEQGQQKGRLIDAWNGNEFEFANPGNVNIKIDDLVIYISIITGNGKVVNVVKEKLV